jgi:integrase/recombinase XerD
MEKTYTDYIPTVAKANQTLEFFKRIQDTYTEHLKDFIRWAEEREIDFPSVRDYFIYLNQDSGFAPGTIRIKRQAVKKRLKQMSYEMDEKERARIRDFLDVMDHTGETKAPQLNNTAVGNDKYLVREDVKKLLLSARSRKQMAFIRFLSAHGCRINELTGIRLSDVTQVGDIYHIQVKGKGNKYRILKCTENLYSFVWDTFRGETYLFETGNGKRYNNGYISNQIKKLGKHVLNRSISAHTLRHSFATEAVRRGIPIDAIADYLGHSSPAITLKMYCHNQISDTDLFEMDIE